MRHLISYGPAKFWAAILVTGIASACAGKGTKLDANRKIGEIQYGSGDLVPFEFLRPPISSDKDIVATGITVTNKSIRDQLIVPHIYVSVGGLADYAEIRGCQADKCLATKVIMPDLTFKLFPQAGTVKFGVRACVDPRRGDPNRDGKVDIGPCGAWLTTDWQQPENINVEAVKLYEEYESKRQQLLAYGAEFTELIQRLQTKAEKCEDQVKDVVIFGAIRQFLPLALGFLEMGMGRFLDKGNIRGQVAFKQDSPLMNADAEFFGAFPAEKANEALANFSSKMVASGDPDLQRIGSAVSAGSVPDLILGNRVSAIQVIGQAAFDLFTLDKKFYPACLEIETTGLRMKIIKAEAERITADMTALEEQLAGHIKDGEFNPINQ